MNFVTEQSAIAMIAHNLFGFDMLFFIKGYQATAGEPKDLNIGGINFTHINYGNIGGKVKFIDMMKYYQKSFGNSAIFQHFDTSIYSIKRMTFSGQLGLQG